MCVLAKHAKGDAMHAVTLSQKITRKSFPKVHAKRLKCLFEVVASLTSCGKLWISALGRNVRNASSVKHNIKEVDGLVGNKNLHAERLIYYTMSTRPRDKRN